jgi:DNA-directed RNA polymerase specialized sigma24 family protein
VVSRLVVGEECGLGEVADDFEAWVAPHLTAMRAIAIREVGRADADDLVQDALEDAVRGLPPRQRQVISLFYLADLPMSEVASALGISVGSVKTHLSLARNALSATLERT